MFVQVIRGKTSKPAELKAAGEQWQRDLAAGASGWLGATMGVADDGTYVALVRFESVEAAQANSNRPEQGAWWAETEKLFDGPVTFIDCSDVVTFGSGGSDDAGFVQVMQGQVKDVEAMKALSAEMDQSWGNFRPEVIGGITAVHPDGHGFTSAVYFTSEAEARVGEKQEVPAELQDVMARDQALYEGEMTYIDLHEPWLSSPA
jgi:hypothetical protein